MTKSTSIRPSEETLVAGARVLLRNGQEATVTSANGGGYYPVHTTAGIFTLEGRYLTCERSSRDIVEVLPEEPANIVNLSKLKVGDTIVFKSGRAAEVTEAYEQPTAHLFRVSFQYDTCKTECWIYESDGSWFGAKGSEHTIVKVIHKERPAVDVSKFKAGDTLEFVNGDTAVVTGVSANGHWYGVHFRMADGSTDY